MAELQKLEVSMTIEGLPAGALEPTSLRVEEAISRGRKITVTAVGGAGDVSKLLRKGAQISVSLGGRVLRRFEGIVLRALERWRGTGIVYSFTIGTPIDLLALSTDCRIFQDKTVPEIVTQVLTDAGFPAERLKKRLSGTYPKLPSCTQHRETMLAFVSRLLEAEGAFWFFEDGDEGLDLVLADSADAHRPATPSELPFVIDTGLLRDQAITSITEIGALRPATVTLRERDWQKPDLDLDGSATNAAHGSRELYDHATGHVDAAHGKRRAKAHLDALVADALGVRGDAFAPVLGAGREVTLADGPRDSLDVAWVVTEVTHTWSGSNRGLLDFRTAFRAIPRSIPYRPLPRTPRPRIRGPHTAIVTGPSGQEIHTDEHGRVRLKFPWDRHAAFDDTSSAWARVAQLPMSGAMAIPRIGWEVLVEFEHGDPDRPVVIGRLYNATYLPPYALPSKKTVSTSLSFSSPRGEGHNEIRIDDAAGVEHIHLHAQKDLTLTVAHDRTTTVTTSRMTTIKADEAITVKGNRSTTVEGMWQVTVAGDQTLKVEGERSKTVKKDEKVSVVGDREVTVSGSHSVKAQGSLSTSAEGDVTANVTGALDESAEEGVSIAVGDDMSVTVGAAKSEIAKKGKTDTTDGKRSTTIGAAFSCTSQKDRSILVGGKRTSTVGAAHSVTSGADIQLSSKDALEVTVGAALTLTGASGISFKVGGSKVLVGQGGVVIEASKIKVTSDGPAALAAALVGSK